MKQKKTKSKGKSAQVPGGSTGGLGEGGERGTQLTRISQGGTRPFRLVVFTDDPVLFLLDEPPPTIQAQIAADPDLPRFAAEILGRNAPIGMQSQEGKLECT